MAKLVILGTLFLNSFNLALRSILVPKLVIIVSMTIRWKMIYFYVTNFFFLNPNVK